VAESEAPTVASRHSSTVSSVSRRSRVSVHSETERNHLDPRDAFRRRSSLSRESRATSESEFSSKRDSPPSTARTQSRTPRRSTATVADRDAPQHSGRTPDDQDLVDANDLVKAEQLRKDREEAQVIEEIRHKSKILEQQLQQIQKEDRRKKSQTNIVIDSIAGRVVLIQQLSKLTANRDTGVKFTLPRGSTPLATEMHSSPKKLAPRTVPGKKKTPSCCIEDGGQPLQICIAQPSQGVAVKQFGEVRECLMEPMAGRMSPAQFSKIKTIQEQRQMLMSEQSERSTNPSPMHSLSEQHAKMLKEKIKALNYSISTPTMSVEHMQKIASLPRRGDRYLPPISPVMPSPEPRLSPRSDGRGSPQKVKDDPHYGPLKRPQQTHSPTPLPMKQKFLNDVTERAALAKVIVERYVPKVNVISSDHELVSFELGEPQGS
jgi:hypothetical protein